MKKRNLPTPKQLELRPDVIEARAQAIAKAVLESKPKSDRNPRMLNQVFNSP